MEETYKASTEPTKEQKLVLINDKRISRGHTLFEFGFESGIIQPAILEPGTTEQVTPFPTMELKKGERQIMTGPLETKTIHRKLMFKPGHYYFGALNIHSALKKLKKVLPNIEFKVIK
jgi:hypothetical protein